MVRGKGCGKNRDAAGAFAVRARSEKWGGAGEGSGGGESDARVYLWKQAVPGQGAGEGETPAKGFDVRELPQHRGSGPVGPAPCRGVAGEGRRSTRRAPGRPEPARIVH